MKRKRRLTRAEKKSKFSTVEAWLKHRRKEAERQRKRRAKKLNREIAGYQN